MAIFHSYASLPEGIPITSHIPQDTVEATAAPAGTALAQLAARRPEGAQLLSEVCRRIREVGMGMGKLWCFVK